MSDVELVEAVTATPPRARPLGGALAKILRDPSGRFGLTVVFVILVVAIFAPRIAPHNPTTIDILHRFEGPSREHLLGTDDLGRDTASRLIYATRTAMEVALPSVTIGLGLGLLMGLVGGYLGGLVDGGLIVLNDTLQALPGIVLALVVIALVGPSLRNVVILIAISLAPAYFRVSRALVLTAREEVYVDAERALGAGTSRILGHILPNLIAPMIVLVAMDIPGVIGLSAALSFLGLGVQPPTADWGAMLNEGFQTVQQSAWPVITTCVALALATIGFTFLGESLRAVVDPRVSGQTTASTSE